jgi:glycosyltransferase involved in cell wall biosynthesis
MVRICLSSQTPFLRFHNSYGDLLQKYGELPDPLPISYLEEGEDYSFTPGGVPRMLYPLVKEMRKQGWVDSVQWVTLNPIGPPRLEVEKDFIIHSITLNPQDLGAYTKFKEDLWQAMHNPGKTKIRYKNAGSYAKYNWYTAARMLSLLSETDLFFVHDFQQIQIGSMIGLSAPTVFEWHIPLSLSGLSPILTKFIVNSMENYNSVVVSCKRDLEGLIRAGYHGIAKQIYPYVNQRIWKEPKRSDLDEFNEVAGIGEDDKVILNIARMDTIKGQDLSIKALHQLKDPNLKLVLVGNGSFSGSKVGGLAHPKSSSWQSYLEKLVKELGEEKRVKFTGYLPQNLAMAAYRRSNVVALTSYKEGFGLTVLEGWLYKKPVVVSLGCGSSELVIDGVNGYTFNPQKPKQLSEKLNLALKEESSALGESGNGTVEQCYIEKGAKNVWETFKEAIESFESEGRSEEKERVLK